MYLLVSKCWNGASDFLKKHTSFSVLNFKPKPVLKLLEWDGCLNTWAPENNFSLYLLSLN